MIPIKNKKLYTGIAASSSCALAYSAAATPINHGCIDFFEAQTHVDAEFDYGSAVDSTYNTTTYTEWLVAIGETPDYMVDWDGEVPYDPGVDWADDQVFDKNDVPGAVFPGGVQFSNAGADSDKEAQTDDDPGSVDAIDRLGWQGDDSGESTIYFQMADYLSFYMFDTNHNHSVTHNFLFSDDYVESFDGRGTGEDNDNNPDEYRFLGFLNTYSMANIVRYWVSVDSAGSRYGIDEMKYGKLDREPPVVTVPEPGTLWLMSFGLALILVGKGRRLLPM